MSDMPDTIASATENLVRNAPAAWLTSTCDALRSFPPTATEGFVLPRLPATNNNDLAFRMTEVIRLATGQMSWEALSWVLNTTFITYHRRRAELQIELLWAGPSPANHIPARRIDQALYDLVASANREILLVTFAAAKIARLANELLKAAGRGVKVQLVLEFEQTSEGQLSYDALKAFPADLAAAAEVYAWPVERRERNQAGKPGKLHAKLAMVDDCAIVSSANLTDDAFNRNLEVGVLIKNPAFQSALASYLNALIVNGTLCPLEALTVPPPTGAGRLASPI